MKRTGQVVAVAMLSVLGLVGCSGRPTMDTVPVEGKVTLDGSPVEGATIMFVPTTAGQGQSATGRTDANGVYRLTAVPDGEEVAAPESGTLPGEYMVSIRKAQMADYISDEEAEEKGIQSTEASVPGRGPDLTFEVPKKYRNPRQSGLTATVVDGENNIPFDLTSN
ncbi:carboxypeptidase-like regulatory domain-containing protein [Roseimaritima sediminicola]|uniref:carboxypeptidase-like regulatory domain-containing protein n=1 Tax=Roseimaritima sediminicola TaxID=2662066 RepID=UPI001298335C|nr:carboxypeptidase-like regulatory domain-containing protein [Roseimaritima sediminicola]